MVTGSIVSGHMLKHDGRHDGPELLTYGCQEAEIIGPY
jgi:hypothetical protein